jgi:predicted acetyltransferase
VLSIQDGGASIREGGGGLVRCDIATLASLFASARSATELAAEGQLAADAATIRALDAAFVLGRCSLQSLP